MESKTIYDKGPEGRQQCGITVVAAVPSGLVFLFIHKPWAYAHGYMLPPLRG